MTTEAPKSNPLEDALVAVIKKTTSAVENGVDFLAAQLPEVIQQLLMWHMTRAGIKFVVYAALCFVAYKVSRHLWAAARAAEEDYKKNHRGDDGFGHGIGSVIAGAACAILMLASLSHGLTVLQILIAPKVYLIEYAASLVR